MSRRRIVFDTSTLVSAALVQGSIPYKAVFFALDFHQVWVSEDTIVELAEVLMRPKFDRWLTRASRLDFLSVIGAQCSNHVPEPRLETRLSPPCRDVKDDKFIALAGSVGAHAIVSSDNDLLVLHPWNGIAILTPADFLAGFRDQ